MNTQKALTMLVGGAVLVGTVALLPKIGHADGISVHADGVGVNINDDEGHRHGHHHLRHEEMDAALGKLREARGHLDHGGNEFGGHRVKAIRAADKAIGEIQTAIDYANSHDR
jgi:hypothetical protein